MMIAAITLVGVVAAASPAPTLPPLSNITISAGPRVPSFTASRSVPHDFRTASAIASFDSGRIPLADALASMAPPQTVSAPIGIAVRIVQPPVTCNASGAETIAYAAQVVNARVVSNAERHGSVPATAFRARSFLGLVLEYGVEDYIFHRATRRMPCPVRAIGWGILGAGTISNAAETGFPK